MKTKLNTRSEPVRIVYFGRRIIYICPSCGKPVTFHKRAMGKSLCVKCGQRLDWTPLDEIRTEIVNTENATDAAIIAEKYYQACGLTENDWFNLNEFRKSLIERDPRKKPKETELYLYFKSPKEYGRFKRMNGGKK